MGIAVAPNKNLNLVPDVAWAGWVSEVGQQLRQIYCWRKMQFPWGHPWACLTYTNSRSGLNLGFLKPAPVRKGNSTVPGGPGLSRAGALLLYL